jgi:hypothetical protein
MDMMADYKIKALDNMRQTVEVLSTEVAKARSYVDRVRDEQLNGATAGLGASVDGDVVGL